MLMRPAVGARRERHSHSGDERGTRRAAGPRGRVQEGGSGRRAVAASSGRRCLGGRPGPHGQGALLRREE